MKKPITFFAAITAAAAMSLNAFAAVDNQHKNSMTDFYVPVTYNSNEGKPIISVHCGESNDPIVYSVKITWGSMKYIYNPGDWNPETHEFGTDGTFKPEVESTDPSAGSDYLTVVNHSNTAVTASLGSYTQAEGFNSINAEIKTGKITDNAFEEDAALTELASAVGTTVEEAPCMVFKVGLEGTMSKPADSADQFNVVGNLTLTLA